MVELSWGAQRTENWGWKTFWQPKDSSLSPLRSIGHPECTLQIVACMCRESVPWLYIAPWCICSCWGPSGLSSSYLPVHSRQHCQAVMNLLFFFFAVNAHYFLSFKLNNFPLLFFLKDAGFWQSHFVHGHSGNEYCGGTSDPLDSWFTSQFI